MTRPVSTDHAHQRAVDLLLRGDPIALDLYRWGHSVGLQDAVDRVHTRAEAETARFLADICDDGLEVHDLPPLENDWRNAA